MRIFTKTDIPKIKEEYRQTMNDFKDQNYDEFS